MKKLTILSAIAISGLIYNTANAQIGVRVGFHAGPVRVAYEQAPVAVEQAPVYEQNAPVYHDNNDDYYYLPDVDAYYSVNEQCYYYYDGDNWISAAYLPGAYHDYDWRNANRYEVRAPRPYLHDDVYRSRYNGRTVTAWAHNNYSTRFNNGYANRGQEQRNFDNRDHAGNDQHFDNRGQGNFNQPVQQNRGQAGNNQHADNRGQRDSQPSNQNNGRARDARDGNQHFAQNNSQGGNENHRMSR